MNTRTLTIAALAGALSLSTVAIGVTAAGAATAPVNLIRSCSQASVGNMQIQREDTGRFSIDVGVDMALHQAGMPWKVTVTNNGHVIVRMTTSTQIDGSFSITRHVVPVVGTNHLAFRARNLTTGETCVLRSAF
jgi:hypothetical protein